MFEAIFLPQRSEMIHFLGADSEKNERNFKTKKLMSPSEKKNNKDNNWIKGN